MSHMPTTDGPVASEVGGTVIAVVTYTATGTEGTSFLVPIGSTLSTPDYEITWSPRGVVNTPVLDLPDGVGDRTTTYFRVYAADVLTVGDQLVFVLFEVD
jgi:hypothetical protein